jgi:hypothetical protein
MADKFEREIEEILAKLDDDVPPSPSAGGRAPISISEKRTQKARAKRVRTARPNPFAKLTPTHLLFSGAGVMFFGLIVSNFWGPAIWASFAGVVLFIGAFVWSFRKTKTAGGSSSAPRSGGTFWRDRYIDDRPGSGGGKGRFRR